ncbi:hypothetical protein AUC43_11195 [Hymenobacter sedentarius]|uniref:Uncharacterized protein n=1 Tax=Hymenobacter sedentarius TaxID=1411621 RepID=A0A0U4BQ98_9BACT|nr:hypothetical protein [Hymenobacter sedentarius]ALW85607.1 hypothetical protein AUC43_11195 [Hymenobacter sedentarius]
MKKALFSAAALLCSFAALAQAPAATGVQHPDKSAAKERKHEAKIKLRGEDDDRDGDKADKVAPENHGQTVKAFTQSTTLTGADKGAAVSAVASEGRSAKGDRAARAPRSARGDHGHGGAGNGHGAGAHQGAGAGHRGNH